jgi:hypothetical protein
MVIENFISKSSQLIHKVTLTQMLHLDKLVLSDFVIESVKAEAACVSFQEHRSAVCYCELVNSRFPIYEMNTSQTQLDV